MNKVESYSRTCIICGEQFKAKYPRSNACSEECVKIRNRDNNRIKLKRKRKSKANLLEEDVRKAREIGVSYGVYRTMKQQGVL